MIGSMHGWACVCVGMAAWFLGGSQVSAEWSPRRLSPKVRQTVLKQYGSLMRRGALVLIERRRSGKLKQITIMRWFKAPLAKVYKTIAEMDKYPTFLPNVRSVKMLKRWKGGFRASVVTGVAMIKMAWVTRVKLVSKHRIEMRTISGDVRGGGWSWQLQSVGPKGQHTAAFGTYYSEIQQGSWILRWMLKQMPGMGMAVNVGAGISFVEAALRHAEGRSKGGLKATVKRGDYKLRPVIAKSLELKGLAPLLRHGDLALIESFPDGTFRQAALIAPFRAKWKKVYKNVQNIRGWKRWMPNIRKVRVRKQTNKSIKYKVWIKVLPFYTLKTRHMMHFFKRHMNMKVIGGSIKHARYRYQFFPSPLSKKRASVFVYSLYLDLRSTSTIIRTMFAQNKEVEHGINIATAVIWLNALRRHVER